MRPFSQRSPGELFLPANMAEGWYGPSGDCGCCGERQCNRQVWLQNDGGGGTQYSDPDQDTLFTQVSGTWSWNTLYWSSPTGSRRLLIFNDEADTSVGLCLMFGTGLLGSQHVRCVFNYVDIDNYWFLEYFPSTTTPMRIGERSSGSESTIATLPDIRDTGTNPVFPAQLLVMLRLLPTGYLIVKPVNSSVIGTSEGVVPRYAMEIPIVSGKWGFGTGATGGVTDFWTYWSVGMSDTTGPQDPDFSTAELQTTCDPYGYCDEWPYDVSSFTDAPHAKAPLLCLLTLAGATGGLSFLNGSHILPWYKHSVTTGLSASEYRLDFDTDNYGGGVTPLYLLVTYEVSSSPDRFRISSQGFGGINQTFDHDAASDCFRDEIGTVFTSSAGSTIEFVDGLS